FWHNDYLIVATQVGLPGLAIFLWIWAALAWVTLRTYLQAPRGALRTYLLVFLAALAAMCTQALTDMFFWRNETGPLIWLIVGLICVTINLVREEARAPAPARTDTGPPSHMHGDAEPLPRRQSGVRPVE